MDLAATLSYKPRKKIRNVLTRMQDELQTGPFSILYRSINENLRVRVWTRSYNHVRGVCTGYIIAYDKHWNLAMCDVDEVYGNPKCLLKKKKKRKRRRKKGKATAKDESDKLELSKLTDHSSVLQTPSEKVKLETGATGAEAYGQNPEDTESRNEASVTEQNTESNKLNLSNTTKEVRTTCITESVEPDKTLRSGGTDVKDIIEASYTEKKAADNVSGLSVKSEEHITSEFDKVDMELFDDLYESAADKESEMETSDKEDLGESDNDNDGLYSFDFEETKPLEEDALTDQEITSLDHNIITDMTENDNVPVDQLSDGKYDSADDTDDVTQSLGEFDVSEKDDIETLQKKLEQLKQALALLSDTESEATSSEEDSKDDEKMLHENLDLDHSHEPAIMEDSPDSKFKSLNSSNDSRNTLKEFESEHSETESDIHSACSDNVNDVGYSENESGSFSINKENALSESSENENDVSEEYLVDENVNKSVDETLGPCSDMSGDVTKLEIDLDSETSHSVQESTPDRAGAGCHGDVLDKSEIVTSEKVHDSNGNIPVNDPMNLQLEEGETKSEELADSHMDTDSPKGTSILQESMEICRVKDNGDRVSTLEVDKVHTDVGHDSSSSETEGNEIVRIMGDVTGDGLETHRTGKETCLEDSPCLHEVTFEPGEIVSPGSESEIPLMDTSESELRHSSSELADKEGTKTVNKSETFKITANIKETLTHVQIADQNSSAVSKGSNYDSIKLVTLDVEEGDTKGDTNLEQSNENVDESIEICRGKSDDDDNEAEGMISSDGELTASDTMGKTSLNCSLEIDIGCPIDFAESDGRESGEISSSNESELVSEETKIETGEKELCSKETPDIECAMDFTEEDGRESGELTSSSESAGEKEQQLGDKEKHDASKEKYTEGDGGQLLSAKPIPSEKKFRDLREKISGRRHHLSDAGRRSQQHDDSRSGQKYSEKQRRNKSKDVSQKGHRRDLNERHSDRQANIRHRGSGIPERRSKGHERKRSRSRERKNLDSSRSQSRDKQRNTEERERNQGIKQSTSRDRRKSRERDGSSLYAGRSAKSDIDKKGRGKRSGDRHSTDSRYGSERCMDGRDGNRSGKNSQKDAENMSSRSGKSSDRKGDRFRDRREHLSSSDRSNRERDHSRPSTRKEESSSHLRDSTTRRNEEGRKSQSSDSKGNANTERRNLLKQDVYRHRRSRSSDRDRSRDKAGTYEKERKRGTRELKENHDQSAKARDKDNKSSLERAEWPSHRGKSNEPSLVDGTGTERGKDSKVRHRRSHSAEQKAREDQRDSPDRKAKSQSLEKESRQRRSTSRDIKGCGKKYRNRSRSIERRGGSQGQGGQRDSERKVSKDQSKSQLRTTEGKKSLSGDRENIGHEGGSRKDTKDRLTHDRKRSRSRGDSRGQGHRTDGDRKRSRSRDRGKSPTTNVRQRSKSRERRDIDRVSDKRGSDGKRSRDRNTPRQDGKVRTAVSKEDRDSVERRNTKQSGSQKREENLDRRRSRSRDKQKGIVRREIKQGAMSSPSREKTGSGQRQGTPEGGKRRESLTVSKGADVIHSSEVKESGKGGRENLERQRTVGDREKERMTQRKGHDGSNVGVSTDRTRRKTSSHRQSRIKQKDTVKDRGRTKGGQGIDYWSSSAQKDKENIRAVSKKYRSRREHFAAYDKGTDTQRKQSVNTRRTVQTEKNKQVSDSQQSSLSNCGPKQIPPEDITGSVSSDSEAEVLGRHINQLFIRGDNVVMIALVQD